MDEGVGEAAPVVGLRMVSTTRICGRVDGASEAAPVGLRKVSAKRLR